MYFPTFFIEQKRGWSEIQANTPTYYGIKGVKKAALEFCLGVESYKQKNRLAELMAIKNDIKQSWDQIIGSAASLAEFSGLKLQLGCTLEKESFFPLVSFQVPHQDSYTDLESYVNGLESRLSDILSNIKTWPLYNEVSELAAKKRSLLRVFDELKQKQEGILISINRSSAKIENLREELDKYKQLKRLHDVGSEINFQTEITSCPICESDLYDSLSKVPVRAKPLSVEQNIDFLKNQIEFYNGINNKQLNDIKDIEVKLIENQNYMDNVQSRIINLKSDESQFIELYGQDLKRKVELENEIRELKKLLLKQNELNNRAKGYYEDWINISSEYTEITKKKNEDVSFRIRNELKNKMITNLSEFGYNSANKTYIQISEQTLRPELDGFDIVADSSASDYIRIIWSYTLALLELGIVHESVKHGGFVVFDEPRQHETDKASFASLLNKSSSLIDIGGQVIVATSISSKELEDYDLDNANIRIFNDGEYILKKEMS
ncbi:hypothetical protein KHX94_12050 [Shewanella dokdonensis]|uniref:ATPase involved in DNA repair n=1 Tax=Shewanella dokdonensis TaxID=712036 RepID=A0ABX8DBI1_9GAMM|nr:hypothetical protein [Shewanella dokdonensis]QVK22165.1 hypothetical protein KHX94_12050 [Shewanella dokdonensis]